MMTRLRALASPSTGGNPSDHAAEEQTDVKIEDEVPSEGARERERENDNFLHVRGVFAATKSKRSDPYRDHQLGGLDRGVLRGATSGSPALPA